MILKVHIEEPELSINPSRLYSAMLWNPGQTSLDIDVAFPPS
jgi:hypothetical protein